MFVGNLRTFSVPKRPEIKGAKGQKSIIQCTWMVKSIFIVFSLENRNFRNSTRNYKLRPAEHFIIHKVTLWLTTNFENVRDIME